MVIRRRLGSLRRWTQCACVAISITVIATLAVADIPGELHARSFHAAERQWILVTHGVGGWTPCNDGAMQLLSHDQFWIRHDAAITLMRGCPPERIAPAVARLLRTPVQEPQCDDAHFLGPDIHSIISEAAWLDGTVKDMADIRSAVMERDDPRLLREYDNARRFFLSSREERRHDRIMNFAPDPEDGAPIQAARPPIVESPEEDAVRTEIPCAVATPPTCVAEEWTVAAVPYRLSSSSWVVLFLHPPEDVPDRAPARGSGKTVFTCVVDFPIGAADSLGIASQEWMLALCDAQPATARDVVSLYRFSVSDGEVGSEVRLVSFVAVAPGHDGAIMIGGIHLTSDVGREELVADLDSATVTLCAIGGGIDLCRTGSLDVRWPEDPGSTK